MEPVKVPVDQAEYAKFCYLIKVLDALDRADAITEEEIDYFRRTEGVKADRQFDWTSVSRFCQPQILISYLRGAERFEEDRSFRTHPRFVIIPRTAYVVDLNEAFELTLEDDGTDNSADSAGDALRLLQSRAQQIEGSAAANALTMLRQLSRVLKIKL